MKNYRAQRNACLTVGLLIMLAAAPQTAARAPDDPSTDPFPTLDHAIVDKAVVVDLQFSSATEVRLESVRIVPGPARGRAGQPPLLGAELLDLGGQVVEAFNAWHPLWVFAFDDSGMDQLTVLSHGPGAVTFPFRPNVATLELTDLEAEQDLITVDLIPPVHVFCRDNPADPGCIGVVNRPPDCDANGPYRTECAGTKTTVTLDGADSSDLDQDPLSYGWGGPFVGQTAAGASPQVEFSGYGESQVELTTSDDFGGSSTCTATVLVEDTLAPSVACNAPPAIVPPDAPISFTATAVDQCVGSVTPVVTEYDCYMLTRNGKRIDKKGSCLVAFQGDTLTIVDSGGVGDNIEWTVTATDASGNVGQAVCSVSVENPGLGA